MKRRTFLKSVAAIGAAIAAPLHLTGRARSASHSLAANDEMLIGGKLEMDGEAYIDGAVKEAPKKGDFIHPQQPHPTLIIYSAKNPADEWLTLTHDCSDTLIKTR